MSLDPGARIGRYAIVAPLGAGGMGDVYRAHDDRLGRDVALKILPPAVASDPERLARFRREARAVAAMSHPNIITIFSIEEDHGAPFMTMELIEGRSLDHAIAAGGVSPARFFDIAVALADALTAAHRKGIVHRDLKPGNIMVSDNGQIKVLDFGLAREAVNSVAGDDAATALNLTQAGIVVGTVPYMSPEQIEALPVDARSDLFSLGVVLYELAAGTRPFSGGSPPSVMSSILRDHPRPLGDVRADLPDGVSQLVSRCLEKSPADRFQSALEVQAELKSLRRVWESGAASSHPPGVPAPIAHAAPATSDVSVRPDSTRITSIAVMPFTDLSPAKDQEWFCDGIAEEILNALTPLKGLRVAARASTFSLRGKAEDLSSIGAKLHVATVLSGSVRRAGDRVRIIVQLSEVQNGYQLWSDRYDGEIKDIFDVQDAIARAVAERLKVSLDIDKDARLVAQGTTNIDAYQRYLKGRALLSRRGADLPGGLAAFREAVALDPDYAAAWAGIADAFTLLAFYGASPADTKQQAVDAADRALALDPSSAAGHSALACASLMSLNDPARADQEFERALQLQPNYVQGRCWYAMFYLQWTRGQFERGVAEARRAFESDPLSAYAESMLSGCLYTAGLLDEAIARARHAIQQDPASFLARWALGVSLSQAERYDEAVIAFEEAAAMSGRHPYAISGMAVAYGRWGKREKAQALLEELKERGERAYVPAAFSVPAADAAGERDLAIEYAQRAWTNREPPFILMARHFPEYRPLRDDPRFQAILREMDATPGARI